MDYFYTTITISRTQRKRRFFQFIHSCCCQRSFHVGRRADDERLLPCRDVGAETGRERGLLLVIKCEAEEGRL